MRLSTILHKKLLHSYPVLFRRWSNLAQRQSRLALTFVGSVSKLLGKRLPLCHQHPRSSFAVFASLTATCALLMAWTLISRKAKSSDCSDPTALEKLPS